MAESSELAQSQRLHESERIARLGHDLKSPLGAIRGFSTLLREFIGKHPEDVRVFPLRMLTGIDQASQKMLEIIEAAEDHDSVSAEHVSAEHLSAEQQEAVVEGEKK